MIVAENLQKIYHSSSSHMALKNINLKVARGEFVAIMGPSGAGKTTLLNILGTIDRPTEGNIFIDDVNMGDMKENELADFRKHALGFVFQDFNLIDTMTIFENIALPKVIEGSGEAKSLKNSVSKLAERLGIEALLLKYPYQLSGGERQRAAIARALMNEPRLILADEPTGNLDTKSAINLLSIMQEIHKKDGISLIMVTHDPFVASFTERVIFIKDGLIYSEMHHGDNRKVFYDNIINALRKLGGE